MPAPRTLLTLGLLAPLVLSGCAGANRPRITLAAPSAVPQPMVPANRPAGRVISRDLLAPARSPALPRLPTPPPPAQPTRPAIPLPRAPSEPTAATSAPVVLGFANESTRLTRVTRQQLGTLYAALSPGHTVLLVGHSHGPSRVGNAALAQGRTHAAARHLTHLGLEEARIRLLASWSHTKGTYMLSRGVRAFILPEHGRLGLMAIAQI